MHGKLYLEQGDEKYEEHDFESHFGHIPQTKGPGWPGDEQAGSGVLGLVCSCSACSACVKDSSELTACMTATQLGMGTRLSLASQLRCSLWLFVTSSGSDELCKVVTVLKTCMYCHPETCNATYLKEIIKHFFFLQVLFQKLSKEKAGKTQHYFFSVTWWLMQMYVLMENLWELLIFQVLFICALGMITSMPSVMKQKSYLVLREADNSATLSLHLQTSALR